MKYFKLLLKKNADFFPFKIQIDFYKSHWFMVYSFILMTINLNLHRQHFNTRKPHKDNQIALKVI